MKCPKCGYLGFERVDRCRNCGYDFAFTPPAEELELPLRGQTPDSSTEDLAFLDVSMAPQSDSKPIEVAATLTRPPDPGSAAADPAPELPLFGAPIADDVPLITKPSAPRQPLAVRRSTPEIPRLRSVQPRPATLDLGLEASPEVRSAATTRTAEIVVDASGADLDAPVGARLMAVIADLLILLAIDVVVVYFTMQICGIGFADLGLLPRAPLFAFLLVQNGGYLVAFTAGGQTLGKMAAGIKVVAAEPRVTLDFGRAFIRELVWLGLAVPAGLGLLTVLSSDRRGVHDRFAGTRVVRA
jgi:uncharacterized RDD family membrane protein YckC